MRMGKPHEYYLYEYNRFWSSQNVTSKFEYPIHDTTDDEDCDLVVAVVAVVAGKEVIHQRLLAARP